MEQEKEVMHRRRITLKDGRYMIFYTFGDETAAAAAPAPSVEALPEAEPQNEAEDEP